MQIMQTANPPSRKTARPTSEETQASRTEYTNVSNGVISFRANVGGEGRRVSDVPLHHLVGRSSSCSCGSGMEL